LPLSYSTQKKLKKISSTVTRNIPVRKNVRGGQSFKIGA